FQPPLLCQQVLLVLLHLVCPRSTTGAAWSRLQGPEKAAMPRALCMVRVSRPCSKRPSLLSQWLPLVVLHF
ncbi:hypothetical protein BG000_003663, partial [Podila horticola]